MEIDDIDVVEDSYEETIPIEDIMNKSKIVRRCTSCKHQCFGHVGVTGENCSMVKLSTEEIEKDDEEKNKLREESRNKRKRKRY